MHNERAPDPPIDIGGFYAPDSRCSGHPAESISGRATDDTNSNVDDEESVKNMFRAINKKLNVLDEVKSKMNVLDDLKKQVDELGKAVIFHSQQYNDMIKDINKLGEKNKELKRELVCVKNNESGTRKDLMGLSRRFNTLEQYGRKQNIEIHGIEETRGENIEDLIRKVTDILVVSFSQNDVEAAHRVPTGRNGRPNMINRPVQEQEYCNDSAGGGAKEEDFYPVQGHRGEDVNNNFYL
ncbi:hypothetical protein J6590_075514 [Homalodisca vitripennis]|nr:hypothetical protein J6590_075514 [Homalodisca vitripennis]